MLGNFSGIKKKAHLKTKTEELETSSKIKKY
jgi:hypothetical protein